MSRSLLSELNAQLAHPKPDCEKERAARKTARLQSRRGFRELVFAADHNTCQWCGERRLRLDPCHIENKRPNRPDLDSVENGICLCLICHYWFDEGGKVNGHKISADQFRVMVFEKHEKDKTFRHAPHLKRLREKMGVGNG